MKSLVLLAFCLGQSQSLLYPRESPKRDVRRLDGFWKFILAPIDDPNKGFVDRWFERDWDRIGLPYDVTAVPSSYNDLSQDAALRDHVGYAWYQRRFFVPTQWTGKRIVLNFGSAHYNTIVFVNGKKVMEHTLGHLPFESEIQDFLNVHDNEDNVLTVAINNTMTLYTLPQGKLIFKINDTDYPPFYYKNEGNFDFFNYAGIHRSVFLYSTAKTFVSDVLIRTVKADEAGKDEIISRESEIYYNVSASGADASQASCLISILNKQGREVLLSQNCSGLLVMENPTLWWPHTHSENPGYQYWFNIFLSTRDGLVDIYPMKFGIRTVEATADEVLLNGKPFYFTGFGKHEDTAVRGKGLDLPSIVKDINLIKWIGANSFRTSHYPYSEELMDLCDEMGIVVIDECPAVGLEDFNDVVLALHKKALRELISRDKNRPSVFMWSIANEPGSNQKQSEKYFEEIARLMKSLDQSRPMTAALNQDPSAEYAAQFLDVIMFNYYASWYSNAGALEVVERQVVNVGERWRAQHQKPVMMSEYGADTVSGLHTSPASMFSEDYQSELIMKHHRALDILRARGGFIGEHIWNFADFMTAQGTTRVIGNRKGILTRDRQPKAAAKVIRCRYHAVGNLTWIDDSFYCPRIPVERSRRHEF